MVSVGSAWGMLILAGLLEVVFATGLKSTQGGARPAMLAITLAALAASLGLLNAALRTLPVGSAYAVWTGIGAAGTAIAGIALLGDPASPARLACIGLIIAGVVGLRLAQ